MDRRNTLKLIGGGAALFTVGACATTTGPGNIVQVASGSPDFSTLVAALRATAFDKNLEGTGPFTVFAPTNAAFDRLPAGTVENLLLPENLGTLGNILKYHVVRQQITSDNILGRVRLYDTFTGGSDKVGTLNVDGTRPAGKYGTGMIVNDANIISPDILASNGVIHAIDKVLIPPQR